jgi:predicted dehydrogenase
MTPIRIGMVGLGAISRFYLAGARQLPGFQLAALCDVDEAAMAPYRSQARCYPDHRAMLDAGELDAVVVNVPNDLHVAVCDDAIKAGLPVCVEKPLATELTSGKRLAVLARDRRVPLFVAFHRRYNEHVLALRERLRGAAPVTQMSVRYLERIEEHTGQHAWYLNPERCGGGCVADNGPNAFDIVRMFLGDVTVEKAIIERDSSGVDRYALVTLRSAAGAVAHVELDWSYKSGECKDVEVRLADGSTDKADMLAGCTEFKGSLWHEYVGILNDFARVIAAGQHSATGPDPAADGLAALRLVDTVYKSERRPLPATVENGAKREVRGVVVKVLRHRREDRGMCLEPYTSRCVQRGEIHELVVTDQSPAPGGRIDRVGFLGFTEIDVGGVIDRGDHVWIDGTLAGTVLGFDACHFPNHYNILIATDQTRSGSDLDLRPEQAIRFCPPASDDEGQR